MKRKNKLPELHGDFRDFISLLNAADVRYLVIGGFAVSAHGYPRSTKDLDVCVEASEDNAEKLASVVKDFGFGSLGLAARDFMERGMFTQLGYPPVRIDIVVEIDGLPFDEAWAGRRLIEYDGQMISFIGYHELLRLKAIAGRPQDLADIAKLKQRNKDK